MAPRLNFDMISSVGMWPIRKPYQIYLVLPAQKMALLQLTWSFMVVPISGT
jgi:hypothetical protein